MSRKLPESSELLAIMRIVPDCSTTKNRPVLSLGNCRSTGLLRLPTRGVRARVGDGAGGGVCIAPSPQPINTSTSEIEIVNPKQRNMRFGLLPLLQTVLSQLDGTAWTTLRGEIDTGG